MCLTQTSFQLICLCLLTLTKAQQFTVHPKSVVQAEGLEAVFECGYPDPVSFAWFVNRSFVSAVNPPQNVTLVGGATSISILALPLYNNTVVRCRATDEDDGVQYLSNEVSLVVYRIESNIVTDGAQSIIIDWSGQNFTTSIMYDIDITRMVLGSTVQELSVQGLTGTQYTFSHPDHTVCDRFSFTVTPTEGGRRGTSSQPVTGFFTQARGERGTIDVGKGFNETLKRITFNGMIPNCTTYTSFQVKASILLHDVVSGLVPNFEPITFSLPTDKVTEVTVTLIDINGIDLVFENIPTSTYDVQDLIINEHSGGGGINVSVVFAGGSLSPGALVCVMLILTDGSLDFNNMTLTTIPQNRSESVDITVPTGTYRLFAFDLESNGLPRMPESMTAASETVNVTADNVYTWNNNSTGSIFSGQLSHVSQFEPPPSTTSVPMDTTTTSDTQSSSNVPTTSNVDPGWIPGVSVVVLVIIVVVLTLMVVVIVLGGWRHRKQKVFSINSLSYSQMESANTVENAPTNTTSPEPDLSIPIALYDVARLEHLSGDKTVKDTSCNNDELPPSYDMIRKEHMGEVHYDKVPTESSENPTPQYETVASARAGSPTTESGPPPSLPPRIQQDPNAPPLPPPFNPESSSEFGHSEERVGEVSGPPPLLPPRIQEDPNAPPLPLPFDPESSSVEVGHLEERVGETSRTEEPEENSRERHIAREVQYTLVQPKSTMKSGNKDVVDPSLVVYSEVDTTKLKPKPPEPETPPPLPSPSPPSPDSLRLELHPLAGRWEDIAKDLGVDEDTIDEIFTINENNQLRMHDLVNHYFENVHYEHSWAEIVQVLKNIGENKTADKITKDKFLESIQNSQLASVV